MASVSTLLTVENIGRDLGERTIFRDVTAGIAEGDRIGLIGVNGTGKSTLLAMIAGAIEPDDGQIIRRNGLRISWLSQNPVFPKGKTVLEHVISCITGQETHWDTEGEAKAVLRRFGITDPDCDPEILSGGQKKRAALAAAILTPCDLLILDEPTNHLDHEMIEWLQDWLENFQGALLMVTHDRYFLDEVANTIWEIDRCQVFRYEGNYEIYLQKKQERLDFAVAAERKAAALYKQDLAWMMRGARARSTKQKAHIQRFEQLRDREKIEEERQVAITSASSRLGGKTVELHEISKSYGSKVLFRDFSYLFLKADRIGIIGPNGCGKSTLMKVILGEIRPDSGSVEVGQTVKFGCFSQENEGLNERETVLENIRDIAEYVRTEEGLITAAAMCERFLFDGRMQYTPVSKLSGGEKRRLYLLRVLMEAPNVLILDEPTNDLDLQTLRILEDYLDHFAGIVIVVSHDRHFLDRVVTRIFSFEGDGVLRQSEGGYEEYRQRKLREASAADAAAGAAAGAAGQRRNAGAGSGGPADAAVQENGADGSGGRGKKPRQERPKVRLSYKEQREYDGIEAQIDELTERSKELEKEMAEAATDFVRLQELTEEKEKTDEELEQKLERYMELQDLVDSLNANT